MKVIAIAAMDAGRVIGHRGEIPWNIPGEQKRFAGLTRGHTVVMGRKTFDSLPDRYKPLPQRKNVVLTRAPERLAEFPDVEIIGDLPSFLEQCKASGPQDGVVWIIGGEEVYRSSLPYWDELYLTLVEGEHPGDTYFPKFEDRFCEQEREVLPTHAYLRYRRTG